MEKAAAYVANSSALVPHSFIKLEMDFKSAETSFSAGEWKRLVWLCTKKAWIGTWVSKRDFFKRAWAFLVRKTYFYVKDPKCAVMDDIQSLKDAVAGLPENIVSGMRQFLGLSRQEQVEDLAAMALSAVLFFSVAGGIDAEGGLPDLDIKLFGIGKHRNIITHSVLLGFGAEFAMRFILCLISELHSKLPEDHHKAWDIIATVARKSERMAISAVWLAIGVHLFKDAGLFSSSIKPVVGIPGHHSMFFHKMFLETNSALSTAFSLPVKEKRK